MMHPQKIPNIERVPTKGGWTITTYILPDCRETFVFPSRNGKNGRTGTHWRASDCAGRWIAWAEFSHPARTREVQPETAGKFTGSLLSRTHARGETIANASDQTHLEVTSGELRGYLSRPSNSTRVWNLRSRTHARMDAVKKIQTVKKTD